MRGLLRFPLLCTLLTLGACERVSAPVPWVRIDGSSTLYPLAEAVAEDFQRAHRGQVHVTVGLSGTGGGLKKFCRREIDIATASRPIADGERRACAAAAVRYVELPVAWDAVTVVVHPDNDFVDALSLAQLRMLWEPAAQGHTIRWNALDARWPDLPVRLFGAGPDSGTFDYFTEVVIGRARASRGDYTASEDDHQLVQGVAADHAALGYFGYAWFAGAGKRLRAVPIRPSDGAVAVQPSPETVRDGRYQPLSRPLLLYVRLDSARQPAVQSLLRWWFANAADLSAELRMVGLPPDGYRAVAALLAQERTGTVFQGRHLPGTTLPKLLALEAVP